MWCSLHFILSDFLTSVMPLAVLQAAEPDFPGISYYCILFFISEKHINSSQSIWSSHICSILLLYRLTCFGQFLVHVTVVNRLCRTKTLQWFSYFLKRPVDVWNWYLFYTNSLCHVFALYCQLSNLACVWWHSFLMSTFPGKPDCSYSGRILPGSNFHTGYQLCRHEDNFLLVTLAIWAFGMTKHLRGLLSLFVGEWTFQESVSFQRVAPYQSVPTCPITLWHTSGNRIILACAETWWSRLYALLPYDAIDISR